MRTSPTTKFAMLVTLIVCAGVAFLLLNRKQEVPIPVPPPPTSVEVKKFAHEVIGTSVEGRALEAYTFGTGGVHVLFVGGMHGGYEWNSVALAYEFIDYLEAHTDALSANLRITVVPSLNPDGVHKVIGKEGRFALSDVPATEDKSEGRFNARGVDLNRNFDCKWQPKSTWKQKEVSAGTSVFSEPESKALRDLIARTHPVVVVFWHSKANAVYASECKEGILPETLASMSAYATAAHYPAVKSFDSYAVTGDAEGWLASIGIPAITVELSTHDSTEWDRNLAGSMALLAHVNASSTQKVIPLP